MFVRNSLLSLSIFAGVGLVSAHEEAGADTTSAQENFSTSRPDGHAPIGVMGDHTHKAGEWMLSYRFMYMDMKGMRDGTNSLSTQEVFDEGYMMSPTEMSMEMHMLGVMYAPTDWVTVMAMLPFSHKTMDVQTRAGLSFTTESTGINDVVLSGLFTLKQWERQRLQLNAEFSVPTGSIDERDDTPMGSDQLLPYPMQMGSGTVDFLTSMTYAGESDSWSWGGQLGGVFRMGRNDEGYSLGNRGNATGWIARKWADWISSSFRIDGSIWGNIDGRNDQLNPAMIPTADPDNQGGRRIDLALGINLLKPSGTLEGNRLAIEVGAPIYQDLDGPQMELDWTLTAGWQYAW